MRTAHFVPTFLALLLTAIMSACASESTKPTLATDTSCTTADSTGNDSTLQWNCEKEVRTGDTFKCQWSTTFYYVDDSWSNKDGGVIFTVKEAYYKTVVETGEKDYLFSDGEYNGAFCNYNLVQYHPNTSKVTWQETVVRKTIPAGEEKTLPKKEVSDWTCDWNPAKK